MTEWLVSVSDDLIEELAESIQQGPILEIREERCYGHSMKRRSRVSRD